MNGNQIISNFLPQKIIVYISISFLILAIAYALLAENTSIRISKILSNDDYNYIAINQIKMWISNNGDGSHDPQTDGGGFYWPGGERATQSAIFEDGLVWGGKINGEIRFNGTTHRQGLQAGKIFPDGTADDPMNTGYRVYKIRRDWELLPTGQQRDAYEQDYNTWPVQDGAPWVDEDGDGIYSVGIEKPDFLGDEVLYYVANDLDSVRAHFTYGSDPIGLEFQTTVYGFNRLGLLDDVALKRYLVINKSTDIIDSLFIGYWADADLGNAGDDAGGCDTLLNLGYMYNANNEDNVYGIPPAVGHQLIQGPIIPGSSEDSALFQGKWRHGFKNLSMTAFTLLTKNTTPNFDPPQGQYTGSLQFYNFLKGLSPLGEPVVNPNTGQITRFMLPGEPAKGAEGGWHQLNWPGNVRQGDMRYLVSTGPLTMAPGDSQEVVFAIVIARGEDHFDSIKKLKHKVREVQIGHNLNFHFVPEINSPSSYAYQKHQEIILWWENNSEIYEQHDPLLFSGDLEDTTYSFEGYRVWQYRDKQGTDPRLLAVYDLQNEVDIIYGREIINGYPVDIVQIDAPDEGLQRVHTVIENIYDEQPLYNGNPYYFGVTAYAYSEHSEPQMLESEPQIIEVIPGKPKIDLTYAHDEGGQIVADQLAGNGHGRVVFEVIDPEVMTGHRYDLIIQGNMENSSYHFIDTETGDTLLKDIREFNEKSYFTSVDPDIIPSVYGPGEAGIDSARAPVVDGFMVKVQNMGKDSILLAPGAQRYVLKSVYEIEGPGGTLLNESVDVINNLNSTGNWQIIGKGVNPDDRINIDWQDVIGFDNYELRFTDPNNPQAGSEYYASGRGLSLRPPTRNDPKGKGKVPFEFWNIGRDLVSAVDDFRLIIKVLDRDGVNDPDTLIGVPDTAWSRELDGNWEAIYGYIDYNLMQDSIYAEPLPDESGTSQSDLHFLGNIVIRGELPEAGTVIRFTPWRPLSEGDVFSAVVTAPNKNDLVAARENIDRISAFPNPYFGSATLSGYFIQKFIRFTNLPTRATIRIFSLAGQFIRKIEKNSESQWLDWDLRTLHGKQAGSGVYLAHIRLPGIGDKVIKLALIQEAEH